MRVYKLKYRCEKCNEDFSINLQSEHELQQGDLERFTKEIKQKHNHKEHTYCSRCREKILEGKGYPRFIGVKEPDNEERRNGVNSILLFGIFCENCNTKGQNISITFNTNNITNNYFDF